MAFPPIRPVDKLESVVPVDAHCWSACILYFLNCLHGNFAWGHIFKSPRYNCGALNNNKALGQQYIAAAARGYG